ncbi:MAG: hypothetical protein C5B50_26705 [Verrucomicrobia bacterium]|nr:MAG: hypothetical protein C5B50_26705 [Verrucomicrobiota bacterium]
MQTLKADNRQRVRLPHSKPGQVFAYEPNEDGSITLTPVVKAASKERFPPGSLLKYFTPELDKEETEISRAISSLKVED